MKGIMDEGVLKTGLEHRVCELLYVLSFLFLFLTSTVFLIISGVCVCVYEMLNTLFANVLFLMCAKH